MPENRWGSANLDEPLDRDIPQRPRQLLKGTAGTSLLGRERDLSRPSVVRQASRLVTHADNLYGDRSHRTTFEQRAETGCPQDDPLSGGLRGNSGLTQEGLSGVESSSHSATDS